MAYDYEYMEGYELQPTKSVVLNISHKQRKQEFNNQTFKMGPNDMPSIEKVTHLGIIRITSLKGNMIAYVEENIKKARRSVYILLVGGFHDHNGRDVETMVYLYKIYISPVLLYGLELILPTTSSLTLLENFQKKLLKQILSLPTCVADITVNILTGILPIEAQVHIRALSLLNNICNQPDDSVEKSLTKRQLLIKNDGSSSWFIAIKHMLRKAKGSECTKMRLIRNVCQCAKEEENIEHFILKCESLRIVRNAILHEITTTLNAMGIQFDELSTNEKLQHILDLTPVAKAKKLFPVNVVQIERLTRRLLYQLHIARYKMVCGQ
ncbi:unnamed protein product [Mytilus coruscus]|uniref:Reverse transcriptase zinc-binding domain-containing protein n=1 Tax=Mytilus coruscus TaxID=42192 RepID=A0A6J8E620_MYTCO|nr:unnamed protein product [Mytilus coruscus]